MTLSLPRRGVTLMQLLVVLIVLALLLALLLPAVQKVREAAARAQSQNNLKQLAIAVHSYHDTNRSLPPAATRESFSAFALLLPYVEQGNLYKRIDFKKAPTDEANALARGARIKVFLSPLDGVEPPAGSGPTNYFFSAGSAPALQGNNGAFSTADVRLTLIQVEDGTSNTVMVGESLRGDGAARAVTVARQHVALKAGALKDLKPDAGVDDWKNNRNIAGDRGGAWLEGRFLQTYFTATRILNDDRPDVDCGGVGGLSGLRTTLNGLNVALCDGSVRFVSVRVDPMTWQALATRAGGETIGDF